MEQVTCFLMFFKRDSITIDKHETTLSNKINNWRLQGFISIPEKTEQSPSQLTVHDQSRSKSSSVTLDCLSSLLSGNFIFRQSQCFNALSNNKKATVRVFEYSWYKTEQKHLLRNWTGRIRLLRFWFWFILLIYSFIQYLFIYLTIRLFLEGLHEAQFYIQLQGSKKATETL